MRGSPFVTVGLIAAAIVSIGYVAGSYRSMPSLTDQQADNRAAAVRIRAAARHTCDVQMYRQCLQLFDEAKRFDPEGDKAVEIVEGRRIAVEALEAARIADGGAAG